MIRIDTVTRAFGRHTAVDGVSLTIPTGVGVALWGANGAGKTTLIRCVLGLLRFSGRIWIDGNDVHRDAKDARALIGYVPQELGFYDDLRVGEAVQFFGRLKGLHATPVTPTLERVSLAPHAGKRIRELSGGMKQRLALAIALLGDPPVLVLDEVTASLDACGRGEFIDLLARLSGDGRTLLFASHRPDEVATLAQRVAILDQGSLRRECSVAEFATEETGGPLLHLFVAAPLRTPAMTCLQSQGFSPRLNGRGLLVPVSEAAKAGPFRALADARIPIDDFEVIHASAASAHTEHTP